MSNYIGNYNPYGKYEKQTLNFDGTSTEFNLNYAVGKETSILVIYNGNTLSPGVGYYLTSGSRKIKFYTAPMSSDECVIIFMGKELTIPNAIATDADNNTTFTGNYWMPYTDGVVSIGSFIDGSGNGNSSLNRLKDINTQCISLSSNNSYDTKLLANSTQSKNLKYILPADATINTYLCISNITETTEQKIITLSSTASASGNFESQDNKLINNELLETYYPPSSAPSDKNTKYTSAYAVSNLVKNVSDTLSNRVSTVETSVSNILSFERTATTLLASTNSYTYNIPSNRQVVTNTIMIYLNGVLLQPTDDYSITTSSSTLVITLINSLRVNSRLTITYWYKQV